MLPKISEVVEVNATADAVWAVMGAPSSISAWHPGIAASPVTDGVRHVQLEGGGEVLEPVLEHSDADRFYIYGIASGPFAISGYRSRLAVEDLGGRARVVWSGEFEADDPAQSDELAGIFGGVYRAGLEGIREHAEKS